MRKADLDGQEKASAHASTWQDYKHDDNRKYSGKYDNRFSSKMRKNVQIGDVKYREGMDLIANWF